MEQAQTLYALVLGALQGVTEFLPVSSSAHLIVVSWLMDGKPLPLALNVALHFGTLIALLAYFWRDWYVMAQRLILRLTRGEKSFDSDILFPALVIGTIPAGVIGLLFEKKIEALFHNPLSVTLPLAAVGIALWLVDKKAPSKRTILDMRIKDGLLIGLAQACALIPGFSRSGSTIIGARLLGLNRSEAARFSFLLGTPAMAGAALLKADELAANAHDPIFYIGILASAAVGVITISVLLRFLRRFGFGIFAIYRVILALVIGYIVLQK